VIRDRQRHAQRVTRRSGFVRANRIERVPLSKPATVFLLPHPSSTETSVLNWSIEFGVSCLRSETGDGSTTLDIDMGIHHDGHAVTVTRFGCSSYE
jgi:hypothetical protein